VTATDLIKLDVFHCTCLRRVLRRFWPNYLSNEELYEAIGSTPRSGLIRVRRCRWLRHVLRKSPDNILRTVLRGHLKVRGDEVDRERRGKEPWRWKRTSSDGIHGELLLHRPQTGVDGVIFWPASRVLIGAMRMSECE